jgi:hypothetical protein
MIPQCAVRGNLRETWTTPGWMWEVETSDDSLPGQCLPLFLRERPQTPHPTPQNF